MLKMITHACISQKGDGKQSVYGGGQLAEWSSCQLKT